MRVAVAASGVGEEDVAFVVEAERLGANSVWLAEARGHDAFTPLAYLAARTTRIRLATDIAQLGARTPALLAMSAMSMQALSGGRFLLGLGTSGPQVMESWHGVRFSSPRHPRGARRAHRAAAVDADGAGPVRAQPRHRSATRQGGAHRRPPPRGAPANMRITVDGIRQLAEARHRPRNEHGWPRRTPAGLLQTGTGARSSPRGEAWTSRSAPRTVTGVTARGKDRSC
jgi:alkanesulfonate monooxygenase SsuD/methylene tetrahydromethanopterin reductase-like flavin-dependent oxidoreductase (luciferase family)